MKTAALLVSILFASLPGMSQACGDAKHPVLFMTQEDGTKMGLFISQEQIEQTERWQPGEDGPPLSVNEAHAAAMAWADEKYARYDDVEVREISLSRYGCSRVSDRWYYILDLLPVMDGNRLFGGANWVAVLMDGSVIGTTEY